MLPLVWTAFTTLSVIATVTYMFRCGRQSGQGEVPSGDEMRQHLVIGKMFYANPNDPRGWVPKTSGVGQTVNFRSPAAAWRFVALIGLTLACAIGLVLSIVPW